MSPLRWKLAREVTFLCPFEIPRSTTARNELKFYLEAQLHEIGCFGKDGRSVGIGFEWETHTGLASGGLHAICTLLRRVQRALFITGILSRQAEIYLLKSKITYIRDGDPSVTFHLIEE